MKTTARKYGITIFEQEESYTSKASFLDKDPIPVYGAESEPVFSGKRIKRGLYRSKEGIVLNADVNGAANIGRKYLPDMFRDIENFEYLYKTVKVIEFKDLNPSAA